MNKNFLNIKDQNKDKLSNLNSKNRNARSTSNYRQQVVSITYEEIGLFPRSFNRVFDRFFKQLFFDVENLVIQEYRFYRYLFLTTVKCVFILICVPLTVNFFSKNYLIRPITEYYWNSQQSEIFLNSYMQKRAFNELKDFEEKIYFESLIQSPFSKTAIPNRVHLNSYSPSSVTPKDESNLTQNHQSNNFLYDFAQVKNLFSSKRRDKENSYSQMQKEEGLDNPNKEIKFQTLINKDSKNKFHIENPQKFVFYDKNKNNFSYISYKPETQVSCQTNICSEVVGTKELENVDQTIIDQKNHSLCCPYASAQKKDKSDKISSFSNISFYNIDYNSNLFINSQNFSNFTDTDIQKFGIQFNEYIQNRLQKKIVQLANHYNEDSIEAITNFFADFISFTTLWFLLLNLEIQINITKSFLLEVFFGLDDSKKSLLILFITDLLVGYHSPNIWELFFSSLFDHYGLPENQTTIFLLVATLPVLLDVLFKYLIFRHLNRASPATVATYHAMIE